VLAEVKLSLAPSSGTGGEDAAAIENERTWQCKDLCRISTTYFAG
jgi:hypothetical protein